MPHLVGEIMHTRISSISLLVQEVLDGKYMFGKYCQQLNTIIYEARDDGYVVLHNIMRMLHTILMEEKL